MPSSIANRATDPRQYDAPDLSWASEADPEAPGRKFIWDALEPFQNEIIGKDVLDVGAGTGWFLVKAQTLYPKKIYGIEPSRHNVEVARKKYPEITIEETSIEHFATTERFDRIFALMMISHVHDVGSFFEKMYKLLRSQGRLYIITGDFDYTRRPRFGYDLLVENIDERSYYVAIRRSQGMMAEIIRHPDVYLEEAAKAGFNVSYHQGVTPTSRLMEQDPKYREFSGITIAQLFVFEKK